MRIFLRGNFGGLGANLLGALVDGGFECLSLGFKRFRLAPRLLALVPGDQLPAGDSEQQEEQGIHDIGQGGPVPGRKDGEGVDALRADQPSSLARAHAEPIMPGAKAAVVRFSSACPRPTNPCPRLRAVLILDAGGVAISPERQTGSAARCSRGQAQLRWRPGTRSRRRRSLPRH